MYMIFGIGFPRTGTKSRVVTADGDDHVSSFELNLWNLTYECLLRYGCPVIFRVTGPNAPLRINQTIEFKVPVDHPACEAVIEFLREELKGELRAPTGDPAGDDWFWGCFVIVRRFSGLSGYLDRESTEAMAEAVMESFMRLLSKAPTN